MESNNEEINKIIDKFFQKQNDTDIINFSSLYLLVKHVNICYGINSTNQDQAIWPGAMAILAGIDMLSLYWTGESVSSGYTYVDFCNKLLNLEPNKCEALFALRNAMLHGYGLRTYSDFVDQLYYWVSLLTILKE